MVRLPTSIREINDLTEQEKRGIYATLIPQLVIDTYNIDLTSVGQHGQIRHVHPAGSRAMEMSIYRTPADYDPLLYLNMADTFDGQLIVLLVVANDLDRPRFNIDCDSHGNKTYLGTAGRNIAAERAAMTAGLSPGQIRHGLRVFRSAVPVFERFVSRMQHDIFLIEPLAYHNAIVFERYGFNYMRGLKAMQAIHAGFQPNREYHRLLTPDNPFRQLDAWRSVRGRSWAIHDGILGHPFTGFQMYKRVGHHAKVNTFPDAIW